MASRDQTLSAPTKQRILDTAERLFAETGFRATSLRELTAAAGVNLAAVHYHFGSKEGLIQAVFARRLDPINSERLERLNRCEAEHADEPIPIVDLLDALLAPSFRLLDDEKGRAFPRLLGRLHSDPDREKVRDLLFDQFVELRRRFVPAFLTALPHLDEAELFWRLHFVLGSMAHTLTCGEDVEWVSQGRVEMTNADDALRRLIHFSAHGLMAPSIAAPRAE